MNRKLVIIGAGGHGRVAADIAKEKYEDILFLDDDPGIDFISGPVSDYKKYINTSDYFIAIGDNNIRNKIFDELNSVGANIVSLISSTASIGSNVQIKKGTIVMNQAVVNNGSFLGYGTIVNTYASIDHDCNIENFCHIAVSAHLAGTVKTGKKVFVGAGGTIINNITICDEVVIGAGATVVKDINEKGTYIGVPAKKK